MSTNTAVYGYCPECGLPGTIRARDTIATTYCPNQHEWIPTTDLVKEAIKAYFNKRPIKDLNLYSSECHEANRKWWISIEDGVTPLKRNKGELIALMHSELSEALEGERKDLMDDKLPNRKMAEVELVDCLIRIFDYAGAFGYDLQGAYEEKMEFNKTREDHTHEARKIAGGKQF